MHELSIVMSIVDIATREVQQAGATEVESIELDIGQLAGIEFSALDFAWELGVQGSVLKNAQCKINKLEGKARCMDCGFTFFTPSLYHACPQCGEYLQEIIQGKELKVKSLTVVKL